MVFVHEKQIRSQRRKSSHEKSLDPVSSCLESSNNRCLDHCAWPIWKKITYTYINNGVQSHHFQSCCHYLLKHKRTDSLHAQEYDIDADQLSAKLTKQTDPYSTLRLIATKRELQQREDQEPAKKLYDTMYACHSTQDVELSVSLRLSVTNVSLPTLTFFAHPS